MPTPFINRTQAGRELAVALENLRDQQNIIVLGLPRGGVPVAAEVATALGAPLDVLLVRKIGAPNQPELALGAIATGDEIVLDEALINQLGVSNDALEEVITREQEVLAQRENLYRGDKRFPSLSGKTVVIVDDGLATGSTMRVAISAVRRMNPPQIVVGVPVGATETVATIGNEVDRIECVETPPNFMAVGRWFHDFRPVTDEEVISIVSAASRD